MVEVEEEIVKLRKKERQDVFQEVSLSADQIIMVPFSLITKYAKIVDS
jgi:hypothetical protein